MVAFTPAVASMNNSTRFIQTPAEQLPVHTRVYTLSDGESVVQVAQKFNMSLVELRKLNQFRTFAHGFEHLQVGDELDVPVAPLPKIQWDDASPQANRSTNSTPHDALTQKAAGIVSQMGAALANSPGAGAAASEARGISTGEASNQIQQWLSRFGTARVQLDSDQHFSLKNSQFDLLVPLYEQSHQLIFT